MMKKILTLLMPLWFILAIWILAVSVSCGPQDGRLHKTRTVYTVQHDGHMFVLFNGNKEGGIIHHPSCSHSECQK